VAFEGLDQSGKQTQAGRLAARFETDGRAVTLISFPDYDTPLGGELGRALRGERAYGAELMQLLYVANRYEHAGAIASTLAAGGVVVCDRYLASSVAYGEAQGLDPAWLRDIQRHLPQPGVTILLDIAPEVSARRKTEDRDRYERDLALLGRVRDSYLRQAAEGWRVIDADRDRDAVAADVHAAVAQNMGSPAIVRGRSADASSRPRSR
jgi:dTMP kinase